jgi:hypothetical protein
MAGRDIDVESGKCDDAVLREFLWRCARVFGGTSEILLESSH